MPATTVTAPAPANQAQRNAAPALIVPFTRAAKEHIENFVDVSQALGASAVSLGPYDVPAYGFLRSLILQVEATGGAGGAATVAAAEDAPWSSIDEVSLIDVNGAPIVGPLSGYDLYLVNKYGGYNKGTADPKQSPAYSGVATGAGASGNFAYVMRLPVEVSGRDGLGSLANQNAASTYKLRVTLAPAARIYSTAPATTLPTVRLRVGLDAWTQPTQTDLRGNANATTPPAHGTTSYWSKTTINFSGAGFQQPRLPRVGNYIRDLIFVYRDPTGSRAAIAGNFPDPLSIYWDTRLLKSYLRNIWRHEMARKFGLTAAVEAAAGLDNGVFVEDFAHDFDGRVGWELRDAWLPTVQSTRLEVAGTFGAAGSLTVLTNDVSPAGEVFV